MAFIVNKFGKRVNPNKFGNPVVANSSKPSAYDPKIKIDNSGTILAGDPRVKAAGEYKAGKIGFAAGSRQAKLRELLVKYGISPNFDASKFTDLDAPTIDAARNNPHSIFKRLREAYDMNVTRTRNSMESRGILHSGATDQAVNTEGLNYSRADSDAFNELMSMFNQALSDYQQAELEAGGEYSNVVSNVQTDLANDDSIVTTMEATRMPGLEHIAGKPVYSSGDGRYWVLDENGKPVPYTLPNDEFALPMTNPYGGYASY